MSDLSRKAAITGIGISRTGRKLGLSPTAMFVDAAKAAILDAGLVRDDIDGVTTYPGRVTGAGGMSPIGSVEAINALGLQVRWHSGGGEGPAQMSALMIAAMAVETGMARHCLVFRCLNESSAQSGGRQAVGAGTPEIGGWLSWLVPMGAVSAVNWAAMYADRAFHDFGWTREMLGAQAVWQRECAAHNPNAVMREKTLTPEDYLEARMISDPLCLFDCDVPIDGAAAFIVSAPDAARNAPRPPLRIAAMGAALDHAFSWDQRPDLTTMAAADASRTLWEKTDLKPADVQVAGLYDGFSIFVPMWLEALGFCGRGEAGAFMAEGRTRIGGDVAVNTGGGQLSAGRLHGYGLLHETCVQLRGDGGGRQTPDAKVGIVGMGGGPLAGACLLVRD